MADDDWRDLDRSDDDEVYACSFCEATFETYKALSLHETGSHRQEYCRICGDRVGIRGLANHEAFCASQRSGHFDDILPTDALRATLRDWLERANEPVDRPDIYCVACEEGEPEFVRDVALCERMSDRGACWVFPASRISDELFKAPPRRDRRTGIKPVETEPSPYDQAPLLGD